MIHRPVPRDVTNITSVLESLRRLNGSAAYWTRLVGALLAEPDIASTLYYRDTHLRPRRLKEGFPINGINLWQILQLVPRDLR
jgi:hypothetical protein